MELQQILYSEGAYLLTARLRGVGGGGLFNLKTRPFSGKAQGYDAAENEKKKTSFQQVNKSYQIVAKST